MPAIAKARAVVQPPARDGLRPARLVCAPGPDESRIMTELARIIAGLVARHEAYANRWLR